MLDLQIFIYLKLLECPSVFHSENLKEALSCAIEVTVLCHQQSEMRTTRKIDYGIVLFESRLQLNDLPAFI